MNTAEVTTALAATTVNISNLQDFCGSDYAMELVAQEDRGNFMKVQVTIWILVFFAWLMFALWHKSGQNAYYKSLQARYLFETRAQTCCRPRQVMWDLFLAI